MLDNRNKKENSAKRCELHVASFKAFSYIEAILSVFILSIGIMVVISLMSSSLVHSLGAKNDETAVLLAQEGIELVRNIRDNNWARGEESFNNLPDSDAAECRVDYNDTSIDGGECGNEYSKELYLQGGFYAHDGGESTKFKRRIEFDFNGANEVIVTSVVYWGASIPPEGFVDSSNCSVSSRCAYVRTTLSRWGE